MKLQLAGQHFTWSFLLADVSTAIRGIEFLGAHNLTLDPANCRLVQAGGHVFPTTAVTSGPTASVITGASPPTLRPASAAAGVKLPSRLPAAALSVGREATSPHLILLHFSRQAFFFPVASAARERAASAAADVKLLSGLSTAALSVERPHLLHPLLLHISRRAFLQRPWPPASGTRFPRSDQFQPASCPCFSSAFSSALRMWLTLLRSCHIHLTETIASPFRRLDTEKLAAAKVEFAALE